MIISSILSGAKRYDTTGEPSFGPEIPHMHDMIQHPVERHGAQLSGCMHPSSPLH
jgi:hypothetical protein